MYSLHMPILDDTDKETPIAKKLLKEILGYTDEEVRQFAATMFDCCVAKNLSIEQVKLIVKPFNYDNGINIYLKKDGKLISYIEAGINLTKEPPKDHYYDQPVVSRDQLVNPLTQKAIERQEILSQPDSAFYANVPKCPTCGSTNIRKMGSIERGASILTFGIFSKKINKTFKCQNCGMTF